MVGDAVAHCFYEDGFAAVLQCHTPSFLRYFANGEDVVSIDADGVDTVAYASAGYAIATILLQGWGGDRIAVVAANEDDGTGASSRYVQGGMKVAFAGCTFAEVARHNTRNDVGILESLDFESVGGASGRVSGSRV